MLPGLLGLQFYLRLVDELIQMCVHTYSCQTAQTLSIIRTPSCTLCVTMLKPTFVEEKEGRKQKENIQASKSLRMQKKMEM